MMIPNEVEQQLGLTTSSVEPQLDIHQLWIPLKETASTAGQELYDIVRRMWKVASRNQHALFALPVYRSVVREVHTVSP